MNIRKHKCDALRNLCIEITKLHNDEIKKRPINYFFKKCLNVPMVIQIVLYRLLKYFSDKT